MKKATLQFLLFEREELRADIGLLETGQREIVELGSAGRRNVTLHALARLLDRLGRFEEMIAAYEAGLA
jgi:hypothetical protein